MRDRWRIKNNDNKITWLKIHIIINKSKKILSMTLTDEHVYDSKTLPELIENALGSYKKITIGKLFAEYGAYEGNDLFEYLGDSEIQPCIRVGKNAKIKLKLGHILRNLSVLTQINICKSRKISQIMDKDVVETVFSCIKRTFGEYV